MDSNEETVAITRVYDAPLSRVFEAWTRAEHLSRWFAPRGFAITDCQSEPRPGGIFQLCMRSPRGEAFWVHGQYREVVAPERLLIACTMHDPQGTPSLEEIIGVQFEKAGSRTRVRLNSTARGVSAAAAMMLAGLQKGWAQTVDRLGDLFRPNRQKEM
jgi:uncharacterized protein YndB with AHSA1/START domain